MIVKPLRAVASAVALAVTVVAVGWPSPALAAPVNDPDYSRQWGLRRIGAPAAWSVSQGAGTVVAVIDTGVNYRHADLKANVLKTQYDAINDDTDAMDLQGHGTAVAGVIGAVTNNKRGMAAVAPKTKIMAVRAFGASGGAAPADVADAIMWSADNGADVINLSLGSALPINPSMIEVAMLYALAKGSLVVAAAGNESQPYCSSPSFNPAAICVGASDGLDGIASFSNYGLRLDVVAPGTKIWTTGGTSAAIEYSSIQGTSFAAPHVAGVGALLMSMGANNVLAGLIIRATAKDLGLPAYDLTYGFGRLDAKAAVDLCQRIC